jgi:hypothetical protein
MATSRRRPRSTVARPTARALCAVATSRRWPAGLARAVQVRDAAQLVPVAVSRRWPDRGGAARDARPGPLAPGHHRVPRGDHEGGRGDHAQLHGGAAYPGLDCDAPRGEHA